MKKITWMLMTVLFVGLNACKDKPSTPLYVIKTDLGDIYIELYPDAAPVTVRNFLAYVDKGLYSDAAFYRTVTSNNQANNEVKIEVIQGGIQFDSSRTVFPSIEHETTNRTGILHKDGVLSMARLAPGSADSEFFICIGDQPELDFGGKRNPDGQGFAAFGRVIKGLGVVKKIQNSNALGQSLNPPIRIYTISKYM